MKNIKKVLSLAIAALMVVGALAIAPVDTKADVVEAMPEGLTELTFEELGFANAEYTASTPVNTPAIQENIANGVVIAGEVKFQPNAGSRICFGLGVDNSGFKLHTDWGNEGLVIQNMGGNFFYYKFTEDIAGVPVIGEYVDLKLSLQKVDNDGDGAEDDLKLGAWFAGKLYDNQYIYINDYPFIDPLVSNITVHPHDGVAIGIRTPQPPAVMPEGLTEFTYEELGFANGTYGSSTSIDTPAIQENITNGVVITGEVKLQPNAGSRICFGAGVDNNGFKLHTDWGNNLVIQNMGGNFFYYQFTEEIAGVPVVGEYVDLKLTLQKVDNDGDGNADDLKLGAWFADVLYNNEYIYINDYPFIDPLVSNITVHPHGDAAIEIKSPAPPAVMPEGLTEFTYEQLGIANGNYTVSTPVDTPAIQENADNGVVIVGEVTLQPNAGSRICFGAGVDNNGFKLHTDWGNNLVIQNMGGNFFYYAFTEEIAGVPVTGEAVDLKLTLQKVDNDGDGNADDLKLGAWFADVLYNNTYIYINDYPFIDPLVSNITVHPHGDVAIGINSPERDDDTTTPGEDEEDTTIPDEDEEGAQTPGTGAGEEGDEGIKDTGDNFLPMFVVLFAGVVLVSLAAFGKKRNA